MELYIHIPFCLRKCNYCDFISYPNRTDLWEPYIALLLSEAEGRFAELSGSPCSIETVYIGGGTPSLLPSHLLIRLMKGLKKYFDFSRLTEFTIEANPGTVTPEWADAARALGANRISLGMQAAQTRILEMLGRLHTLDDVQRSVKIFRSAGFANISLDLMFGIPDQTVEDWRNTLDAALSFRPDHISAYGLIPEPGTQLYRNLQEKTYTLPEPELERDMYDLALSRLKQYQYYQYEISNFARPGYACQHNIGYWSQIPYIGLGIAAASMIPAKTQSMHSVGDPSGFTCYREKNPDDFSSYHDLTQTPNRVSREVEYITGVDAEFETMMLGLRMNKGVSEPCFLKLHGRSMDSVFGDKLNKLVQQGLVVRSLQQCHLTRKGMDLQNSVLVDLM